MVKKWLAIFLSLTSLLCCIEDSTVKLSLLRVAWKYGTGGAVGKPYNEIVVNRVRFGGERKWDQRWEIIKNALPFKGKKILELGSNIALPSVYLLKYRGAASSTAVDLPDAQLTKQGTPHLIRAARLVHRAFGVRIKLVQIDLNNSNYEAVLGRGHDVVVCMSLLKWVRDKKRFLRFLSRFSHVIYEGHDPDDVEIARFQKCGFTSHKILGTTSIGASYASRQKRTIIYFSKA